MATGAGYILLDQGDTPATDTAGRVLGDSSHVRNHLSARRGIATVVVPPSTPGGTPEGFDPHMVEDTVINFDPGRPTGVSYTVAQLRQQQMQRSVSGFVPGLTKTANPVVTGNVAAAVPSPNAYVYDEPQDLQPRHAVPGLRPMEVLQNAGRRQVVSPVMAMPNTRVIPDKIVTFEVTGIGVFQAPYTDVILQGSMLILVFDHAAAGKMCYFPNFTTADSSQEPPAVAMRVEGSGAVYLVHTTGIQFKHGTIEYCVLLIAQTATDE